jgi:hypothetical protein
LFICDYLSTWVRHCAMWQTPADVVRSTQPSTGARASRPHAFTEEIACYTHSLVRVNSWSRVGELQPHALNVIGLLQGATIVATSLGGDDLGLNCFQHRDMSCDEPSSVTDTNHELLTLPTLRAEWSLLVSCGGSIDTARVRRRVRWEGNIWC